MSPADAARLLEISADATPEQIEARFLELRTKLEEKIGKAPTPGLKAKYRESLEEITKAFETLTLAADSSALPVLRREKGVGSREKEDRGQTADDSLPRRSLGEGGRAEDGSQPVLRRLGEGGRSEIRGQRSENGEASDQAAKAKKNSGGREFVIVAAIAVIVLGAGGWWVMRIRAENAEKARIAAEQKAEAERQAEVKKKAGEEERARIAAAEKAEQERKIQVTGQLRSELAATKIEWEAIEREERIAERRLSELKSDLRGMRDAPAGRIAETRATIAAHQAYYDWISSTLAKHPAKIARGRTEELLSAQQIDAATAAMAGLKESLAELEQEIHDQRARMLDLEGDLELRTDPDVTWTIEDAFGQTRSGTGPGLIDSLAVGPAQLILRKPHWADRRLAVTIAPDRPARPDAAYVSHVLELASLPEGAEVLRENGSALGKTPLHLEGFPPGPLQLNLRKDGYYPQKVELTLPSPTAASITLRAKPRGLVRPESWKPPQRFAVEITSVTISPTSNYQQRDVEEWEFSQADQQGGWQQVNRRIIRQDRPPEHAAYAYTGAVIRHQRVDDGTWRAEFVHGGPTDPNIRSGTLGGLSFFQGDLYARFERVDCWPAEEVQVGGTWSNDIGRFPGLTYFAKAYGNRQITGKLIAIERGETEEWADIEYSYAFPNPGEVSKTPSGGGSVASLVASAASARTRGLIRMRVNLSEMFIASMESEHEMSNVRGTSKITFRKM